MTASAQTPVRRFKLYEQVASQLEQMIVRGDFEPGDALPAERDLMERFGVGRTAIREAVFALQARGLVASGNGRRHRVTRPTPDVLINSLSGAVRQLMAQPGGIEHLQQARSMFECSLARHAASHATKDDIERLRVALEANERATNDTKEFERTDVDFHLVLVEIPRNPVFVSIHEGVVAWLREQRTVGLLKPGQSQVAFEAHRRVFDAIRSGDPDLAERTMREHLAQVADTYWQVTRNPTPSNA